MYSVNNKKGFTLIELLVVIAIIGILSSVVLASLNSARRKGRDARRIADVKQLQLALELWYDACGSYTPDANFIAGTGTGCSGGVGLVSNGYIAAIPVDPSSGNYFYDQLTSGSSYCLGADLETSGHSALSSDSGCTGTDITVGTDASGCGGAANRYCYQVTP